MLCQKCMKNEANTHVKSTVNGEYKEYMLCSSCAKEMGYTNLFGDMSSDFNSILGSLFSNALPAKSETTRCPKCGSTYHDIAKSGKVGCAACYEIFLSQLMPSIRRIHGNTTHCGKVPSIKTEVKNEYKNNSISKIESLKAELKEAIDTQNFELAAKLRDEIKEMEGEK